MSLDGSNSQLKTRLTVCFPEINPIVANIHISDILVIMTSVP